MKKKASELRPYDWIRFPDSNAKWARVFSVSNDIMKGHTGRIYVTIEGFGGVSLHPNREFEVDESQ